MSKQKPKPTALKVLAGNPGRRPLNKLEPNYVPGIPEKPEWFGTYASEEWDRLVGNLNGQAVFTKNDLGIMVSVCLAYEQMRENLGVIKAIGNTYTIEDLNNNKHFKVRPETLRFETALREYRTMLADLGFTPSSRSKIKVLPMDEDEQKGMKEMLG